MPTMIKSPIIYLEAHGKDMEKRPAISIALILDIIGLKKKVMKRINNCLSCNDHAHLSKASRKFELQEKKKKKKSTSGTPFMCQNQGYDNGIRQFRCGVKRRSC